MPDRQLLLLRHAKAVPGDAGLADIDRPLAERGENAAAAIGRYLAEHGLKPDLVLCSPARRTRQTWEIAARELPQTKTKFIDELYDFGDGSTLLDAIRRHGKDAQRLMLVTHNPATQALALALAGKAEKSLRRKMAEKYPTAGLALLSFPAGNWADTAEGQGRLDGFVTPRELLQA